jgi:hypothetical protein
MPAPPSHAHTRRENCLACHTLLILMRILSLFGVKLRCRFELPSELIDLVGDEIEARSLAFIHSITLNLPFALARWLASSTSVVGLGVSQKLLNKF